MKQLITGLIIAINLTAVAQSPALTINVLMDPQKVGPDQYSIEMKICEPGNRTKSQDAFSHDTSAIDFSLLKAKEISCGQYSDKGIPELISGDEEPIPPNSYQFSNQVFAWEKIFVFRISNISATARQLSMFIVLPMKYKSFRTLVDINNIEFQPGKVIFLTELNAVYDGPVLTIRQSLKGLKAIEIKDFPIKGFL